MKFKSLKIKNYNFYNYPTMETHMKLQKYMSQSGICSRRKAEEYIAGGEVFVNGEVAHIWQIIDSSCDSVTLWSWAELSQKKYVYYKYNKPRWIETTCAQASGSSIIDHVNTPERVFPVGRLDKETTWLILLTNDGRMTNYLTHPRYGHSKEYVVEVFWTITDTDLKTMSQWVEILWQWTKKCEVTRLAAWKFSIILQEWKNRQIRRMVESVWSKVKKLKRVRIENIRVDGLTVGEYKHISFREKDELFQRIWLDVLPT